MSYLIDMIRTAYYRLKYQHILGRAAFGRGVRIGCRLEIKGPGTVLIGQDCVLNSDPWGQDFVTLFTHKKTARIEIGKGVTLRGTRAGCVHSIIIEDGAIVDGASIFDTDFHNLEISRRDAEGAKVGQVIIGQNAYIGTEALCGKGTRLHEEVSLLPASVVSTKQVPPRTTLVGNPVQRTNRL